jgi:diadenylate cyclase
MAIRLLSISAKFAQIQQGVVDFFQNFGVLQAVEIILFFGLFFFVSKVLRDNEATKLMLLYWFMLFAGSMLHVFDGGLLNKQFLLIYVLLVSSVMLIIFSVEVKKYFWDVHDSHGKLTEKSSGGAEVVSQADAERNINNIVKALQNMSKNNVGALIVLSKGSLPKQVLQSGVSLNADISTQLIEGVFFPKAPLHDGAMVIQGHKIQSAGCFLPLTQKTSYPKEYGTRHRAAIGITEVANVVSLVVSEETGIISIVKQGNVTRYADYDMLLDALKDYYWQEMPLTDKKQQRR